MLSINHIHLSLSAVLTALCLDILLDLHPQSALFLIGALALLVAQAAALITCPGRSRIGFQASSTRVPYAERFLGFVRLLDDAARTLPNTSTLVAGLRVLRLYSELGACAFPLPAGTGLNCLFPRLPRMKASQRSSIHRRNGPAHFEEPVSGRTARPSRG